MTGPRGLAAAARWAAVPAVVVGLCALAGALAARALGAQAAGKQGASAQAAGAHVTGSLDAGTGSARYDGDARASYVVTLAPAARAAWGPLALAAAGTFSRLEGGSWVSQGTAAGSAYTPAWGILRGEVAAVGQTTFLRQVRGTGQLVGAARLHALGASRGVWLGGAAGRAWDVLAGRSTSSGELGGWARLAGVTVQAALTRTAAGRPGPPRGGRLSESDGDPRVPPDSLFGQRPDLRSDTLYTDLALSAHWAGGPMELAGSLGARPGDRTASRRSWDASGTVWLSAAVALAAGAGRYAADPTQGLPGGRYLTLAVRLGARPAPASRAPRTTARDAPRPDFEVGAEAGGCRTVRVRAPEARRVELMGDFTDWQPVALARADSGAWVASLRIPAGPHRLNVRLDGGAWGVPPGVTAVEDDFFGTVGLVIVR